MSEVLKNPLDELLPVMAEAVTSWMSSRTAASVTAEIHALLDRNHKSVALQLLGFSEKWGHLEVDHCNGRAGESAAGDFFKQVQQKAINDWLSTIKIPSLTPKETKELNTSLHNEYKIELGRRVRDCVTKQAQRDAEELVQKISQSHHIDNYGKLLELIHPKT